jgi:hypothetical protein
MELKRNGSQPSQKGPEDYFTGNVRIDSPFQAATPGRAGGAIVTFEPGARTAWRWNQLLAASSIETERFRISNLSAIPVLGALNCRKCKLEVKFCRKFKSQRDWRNRRSRWVPVIRTGGLNGAYNARGLKPRPHRESDSLCSHIECAGIEFETLPCERSSPGPESSGLRLLGLPLSERQ